MDEFKERSRGRIMETIGWIDGRGHATHREESARTAECPTLEVQGLVTEEHLWGVGWEM